MMLNIFKTKYGQYFDSVVGCVDYYRQSTEVGFVGDLVRTEDDTYHIQSSMFNGDFKLVADSPEEANEIYDRFKNFFYSEFNPEKK